MIVNLPDDQPQGLWDTSTPAGRVRFIQEHLNLVIRTAYKAGVPEHEIDDICQEVSIRFMLEDDIEDPLPWIFVVTKNQVRARHRKKRPLVNLGENASGVPHPPEKDPIEVEEISTELKTAIGRLSQRQRTFVLLKQEGLSASEISELFGLSKRTVYLELRQAFETLRRYLHPFLNEEEHRS